MTYDIYVLQSDTEYYVGMSECAELRLESHKNGSCRSSARLGNPLNLKIIHMWQAPNYRLASKLERFCHKLQRHYHHAFVLEIIRDFPVYNKLMQELIDQSIKTTEIEKTR